MQAFLEPLKELADYQEIVSSRRKKTGFLQIAGCVNSQKIHLAKALSDGFEYRVIVFSSEEKAKQAYEEWRVLEENVWFYPARDLLFYHADIKGAFLTGKRMEVLRAIVEKKGREAITVVTTMDAFLDGLPSKEELCGNRIKIHAEEALDFQKLQENLSILGYERENQVESPGQFAVRGGILDVFPLTEENPVRIELWGDEVDSIRSFDVESQRSTENLQEIEIYPATENWKQMETESFLAYFPVKETILFLDEPVRLQESAEIVEKEYFHSLESREEAGIEADEIPIQVEQTDHTIGKMNKYYGIAFTMLESKCGMFKVRSVYSLQVKTVNPYNSSFELLTRDLKKLKRTGYRVILVSGSRTRAKRLAEDLRDYDLSSFYSEEMERQVNPGEIMVTCGYISEGYEYPMLKFTVISESDIFGKKKKKKKRKTYEGKKIQEFSELKPGDYVVHENHGLGIYQGIEKVEVDTVTRDYMKISYADGGILYIPATQMDLIQKYAGADAKPPKLNKLGTPQWKKTKGQVKKAVQLIAKDLVKLYATRQQTEGYVYGPDTVWQREFEEMFPFEETEDQLRAIEDTKKDMESTKIMDRLICGDVGYGKTEIAIRAAFKAVQEGKQVVYLVPTTILAQQHYNTFIQRFKDFPVRVDLMSRFRTQAQQKKTVEDLKKGLVDIVIGTHRVLSKDVGYKDLGLLIIDEEQRFGVKHKETLKELKKKVDVLTLTATPIPRTLHMSMLGIRDLSVIETPPTNRYPVQTFVLETNPTIIRDAVLREMDRGGQAYYLYNKVDTIEQKVSELKELIPEASIGFVHGQMSEVRLENTLLDFINGEYDVLVTTTIIETGVDIPNANTLFIENADHMGLSTLYQLRGRVGRSNRIAYAYLMYRPDKSLTEVSEKRLEAIKGFTELGSGFKIAMRDLSIRGAGNILGASQSGFIDSVGFEMYSQLLEEAIAKKQGQEHRRQKSNAELNLQIDAYLPNEYISDQRQKIEIYKQIREMNSATDYEYLQDELIDRFGEYPDVVAYLLEIGLVKAYLDQVFVRLIERKQQKVTVKFEPIAKQLFLTQDYFKALSMTQLKAQIAEEKGLIEVIFDIRNKKDFEILEALKQFGQTLLEIKQEKEEDYSS